MNQDRFTDEDIVQDLALYKGAFDNIEEELKTFLRSMKRPKTAKDLVEWSSDLRAIAERFDSLSRAVIKLQGRVCL
jgi:hypothetical protein